MKFNWNTRHILSVAGILSVGTLLAWLILGSEQSKPVDEHGHGEHAEASGAEGAQPHDEHAGSNHADEEASADGMPHKGPHGGKLFTQDDFSIEVTIYEQDVPPEFRIYTYQNGKPLDPAQSQVSLALDRLGQASQEFKFVQEGDYLRGDAVVEEPHSFNVSVTAQYRGKPYRFTYAQAEARMRMSDQQVARNGVQVLTAGPVRIRSTLQLNGEIRFNEDRLIHVVPRLAGIVESAKANAGDQVHKGQVLAIISSQALADQRSELLGAQKRLALAKTTHEREKQLWEDKISAEQDYLQARSAMQEAEIAVQTAQQKLHAIGGGVSASSNLTRYEIRSPIDGIVVEKHIALGEAVKDDANIYVIADLSTVWAEMTIQAKDLNVVKVGQKASVKATSFDSHSSGVVTYVGSLVGEQTRSAKAHLVLPNPQGVWRPGLPVSIELVADEVEVPVAVAVEAIQTVRDWTVVFGRYGEEFEARPLTLGRSDGQFVEVLKGLRAGESYAAKNSFLIKAELGKSEASHDH